MSDPRTRVGAVWPMGVAIGQSWFELGALAWLCGRYEIESFVELGMLEGGLSSMLLGRTMFTEKFRYLGVENEMRFLDLRVQSAGAWFKRFELFEADVFEDDTVNYVKFWLRLSDDPAMIYCDNGNKPKELEWYSPMLRKGDVIAAHDFGHEYQEGDLLNLTGLKRIKSDWLTDTHIIAFQKAGK